MKILTLADTHELHSKIDIPTDIDMILVAGDVGNQRDPYRNANEVLDFIEWFESIDVRHKIWIAGNHDTSVQQGLVKPKKIQKTTTYIEHESIEIEGIKIFGSPYTPNFGIGWAFNRDRAKIGKLWDQIPIDTDIIMTHGPCKGILDLSHNRDNNLEYCGDISLLKRIQVIQPKYFISGHIHSHEKSGHYNHGTRTINNCTTTFINASMLEDGVYEITQDLITIQL